MVEVFALLAYDVVLVRRNRTAISTRLRDQWRSHPARTTALCAALVFHLTRPDSFARYDVLSRVGDRIRPSTEVL